jgi:hypothetical protein
MMAMEDFRPTMDETELCWVTDVGSRDSRRSIAEAIGAIAHRLVLKSKVLML